MNRSTQVTEWIIPIVCYLLAVVPGSLVRDQDCVLDAVQAQQKLFCKRKNMSAIHQSLAMLQNLPLKIELPYLTYLSPVCVQVISVQFTGANQIPVLFYL